MKKFEIRNSLKELGDKEELFFFIKYLQGRIGLTDSELLNIITDYKQIDDNIERELLDKMKEMDIAPKNVE